MGNNYRMQFVVCEMMKMNLECNLDRKASDMILYMNSFNLKATDV